MVGILGAIANFGTALVISITNDTVSRTATPTATATYTIASDGLVKRHGGVTLETWNTVPAASGNYEVRAAQTSGPALSAGTLNTWLACSSDNSWSLMDDTNFGKTAVLTVEIRLASSGVVQDTATITLTAESY